MGFIETVNKYGYKIPINKTTIYQDIMQVKTTLEAKGLSIKIKTVFDLFDYEIIYRGLMNQNKIENAYELFLTQHYDLMNYLNYDEKRKMFNNDIASLLNESPHFFDEESQTEIYIPYLESFVNQRYSDDYQLMMLKQHREYVNQYKISRNHPSQLYKQDMYQTDFCHLNLVYKDNRHVCYYYDDLKTIYIFKKGSHDLLNSMIICDHEIKDSIDLDIVKQIAYNLESYLYNDCLELMHKHQFISDRTYRKILRKYK